MSEISLIIPAYNAADHMRACLDAATSQDHFDYEVIVVDDCSIDGTADLASRYDVQVVNLPENVGAAAARNAGVAVAKADYLVFIDSDVVLPPDGLTRMKKSHDIRPEMSFIVAAYSENSAHLGMVSDYKNLDLVYRGSSSSPYKKYACSYCMSLYKDAYVSAGGFNEHLTGAATEDIDFGLRVCRGERLSYNDRSIVVDHLKRYTLYEMLKTNYSRLLNMVKIRHTGEVQLDVSSNSSIEPLLNLFLPASIVLLAVVWLVGLISFWPALVACAFFLGVNVLFADFLRRRRGVAFMLAGIGLLFVEYLHAFVSLCIGFVECPPKSVRKLLGR